MRINKKQYRKLLLLFAENQLLIEKQTREIERLTVESRNGWNAYALEKEHSALLWSFAHNYKR